MSESPEFKQSSGRADCDVLTPPSLSTDSTLFRRFKEILIFNLHIITSMQIQDMNFTVGATV